MNFIVAEIQGAIFSANVVAGGAQTTGMSEATISPRAPGTLWLALATGICPTPTRGTRTIKREAAAGQPPKLKDVVAGLNDINVDLDLMDASISYEAMVDSTLTDGLFDGKTR